MIALRPAASRGVTRRDGLERQHSFSSGSYYDPAHMGFGALRVLDSDRVDATALAASERRANMEILTWITSGSARWQAGADSGDLDSATLDCLSAGSGIDHAIAYRGGDDPLRSVQIWLQPDRVNASPRHGTRQLTDAQLRGGPCLLASFGAETENPAWPVLADARVYAARLQDGESMPLLVEPRRRAWLQVVRGALDVGSTLAANGDGVAIIDESSVLLRSRCDSEFLLIDLA